MEKLFLVPLVAVELFVILAAQLYLAAVAGALEGLVAFTLETITQEGLVILQTMTYL
jgi:hypothetical protein